MGMWEGTSKVGIYAMRLYSQKWNDICNADMNELYAMPALSQFNKGVDIYGQSQTCCR